jgi:diguanylate cyclase (GGDEF)-like protein
MYEGLERRITEIEPKDFEEALLVIEALRKENIKLKDDAKYDPKTGLYAYDYFEEHCQPYLEEVINKYRSLDENLKQSHYLHLVVIADLNNLKQINETKGYKAGDDAIKKVAESLKDSLRSNDLIIRVNKAGDEFMAIISTKANANNIDLTASLIAGRIRTNLISDSKGLLSVAVGYSVLEDSTGFANSRINAEKSMQEDKILQKRAQEENETSFINFF